jgi:hypothetical protein
MVVAVELRLAVVAPDGDMLVPLVVESDELEELP